MPTIVSEWAKGISTLLAEPTFFLDTCRVDCVPAHATLVISAYPQGNALGTLQRFRLALCKPSGVKVLHAGPAAIAGHAYGFM